ncbi:MAG TPA: hypothetical protein VF577_06730 [Allosphingosinicella sp.]
MSAVPILADDSTSALFSVPTTDWAAISNRVGVVRLAAGISDEMTQVIACYPALLAGCQLWSGTTFPGLASAAANVSGLAATARNELGAVKLLVPATGNDQLPPETVALIETHFATLSAAAKPVAQQVAALTIAIRSFAGVNAEADAQAQARIAQLGPGWSDLAGPLASVEAALGATEGSWSALNDDLSDLGSGEIPITTALLTSLAIDSALGSWANVGREADAFAASVPSLAALMTNPSAGRESAPGPTANDSSSSDLRPLTPGAGRE